MLLIYSINLDILTGIHYLSEAQNDEKESELKTPTTIENSRARYRKKYSEVNNFIFIYTIIYFMIIFIKIIFCYSIF